MKKTWLPLFGGIVVLAGALIRIVNAASPAVSQLVTFNPALGQLPESIAIDKRGNIYVSFFVTGEIRQIAPDGTQSTLAILGVGPFPRRLSGLAVDPSGSVYALLNDISTTRGVWRISRNGSVSLLAPIPSAIGVNALAFDQRGSLFVSDPFKASIYRVGPDGSVTVWVTNPLLQGISPTTCGMPFPSGPLGANGVSFNNKGDMFVLNTTQGQIVRIPVLPDGTAAPPEIFVGPTCNLVGLDGQAFDNLDNLYVAVNIQNKIVRIDPNRNMTTIAAAPSDPLFFPSAIAFETGLGQRKEIFITNFAAMGGPPGIATMDVGVPGRPLP